MSDDIRRYAAEFLGTFLLVFFAAGSVMIGALTGAVSAQIAGGLASGLILMIVIWVFADISGGHVNPALTLALCVTGAFAWRLLPGYVLAQLAGSAAAGLCLLAFLGHSAQMGANLPDIAGGVTVGQALGIEVVLSFAMMLVVVLSVAAQGVPGRFFAVPVGAIVGISVMLFGGSHGAAMNPARAFGPHLANGDWAFFWIYVAGPVAGLLLAALMCRFCFGIPDHGGSSSGNGRRQT